MTKYSKIALLTALSLNALSSLYASAFDPEDGENQLVFPGHSLAPLSGNRQQLVVVLHGLTMTPDGMLDAARRWQTALPHAEFLIPAAKDHSWFPIIDYLQPDSPDKLFLGVGAHAANFLAGVGGLILGCGSLTYHVADSLVPQDVLERVQTATASLNRFLDRALRERQLNDQNLFLAGFSQGSIMAMTTAVHRDQACAGVLGIAGVVLSKNEHLKSRPPVCIIHGTQDLTVPYIAMTYSAKKLGDFQCPVETHTIQNLDHHLDHQVIDRGIAFLKKFAGSAPMAAPWHMPVLPVLDDLSPDGTLQFMLHVGRLVQECPQEHKLSLLGGLKSSIEQRGFSLLQAVEHGANVLVSKQVPGALELRRFVDENKNAPGGIEGVMPELITRALGLMSPAPSHDLTDHEAREYLAKYPDLRAAFSDDLEQAKAHWKSHGIDEGRTYNQLTDNEAREYLIFNPDVATHCRGDLERAKEHWKRHGINENRHYNQLTDNEARSYLAKNQDLNAHFQGNLSEAKRHWKDHGLNEGRLR
ncbi:MAG: alpha/beta hydrolase [Alphaproteobacteria bacterium]